MNELIGQLAWPVTVILLALIFRGPLSSLLTKAKHVKYKELEIDFEQKIKEIEKEANVFISKTSSEPEPKVEIDLFQLAEIAPKAAVIEAWKLVELGAKELIFSTGIEVDYNVDSPYRLLQDVLEEEELIDDHSGFVFEELRLLRNKVVHAEDFLLDPEQAKEFLVLSLKLREYFDYLINSQAT